MVEQLPCSLAIAVAAAAAIIGPLLTMVLAAAVTSAGAGESGSNTKDTRKEAKGNRSKNEGPPSVPFYYVPMKQNSHGILSADPPFGDLLKSLDKYRLDTSSFLASLTRQHEVAHCIHDKQHAGTSNVVHGEGVPKVHDAVANV